MQGKISRQICVALSLQLLLASSVGLMLGVSAQPPQKGPRIDTMRWKVTRSPAAQLVEMIVGPPLGSDMWMGLPRPMDLLIMTTLGKTVSSRSAFHMCFFGFNYRRHPLDDVNFRHALAHLMPKTLLTALLFGPIAVKIDSPVPPAQARWYNQNVDPHPYSRTEAASILAAAGYQNPGGVWLDTDGNPLPTLEVYCPLPIVAPTSFIICWNLVFVEAPAIGLTNLVLVPMSFSTYVDLVFSKQDFDIFWLCYQLDRFPTHLYRMFHSRNDFLGGANCYGVHWPELDALLDILYFSLDHPAKVAAVHRAQELVMGGSISDPLAIPAQPERSQAIPLVPFYSRNHYDAQHPSLRGAVNMFGYGIKNTWTWMNIHWNTPSEWRPGTTAREVVAILEDFPERLNQLYASTTFARQFMDPTFDGLMATNPYTHRDEPWLATRWSYVAVPAGMDVTFDLRLTDSQGQPITWQDGTAISADDVKFAWDFLYEWEIPSYKSAFRHYDPTNTIIVDSDTIKARMTTTSQWLAYDLADTAYMLPPQVWSQNPVTGNPWSSTAEILAFDPSAYAWTGGAINLPTMLYGTGPFILQDSTTLIGMQGFGDLTANRNYWLTTQEIEDVKTNMFHTAGDVDYDGEVTVTGDLVAIGLAYGTSPFDLGWNPDADINGDGFIDMFDYATAAKYYKETKHVPHP